MHSQLGIGIPQSKKSYLHCFEKHSGLHSLFPRRLVSQSHDSRCKIVDRKPEGSSSSESWCLRCFLFFLWCFRCFFFFKCFWSSWSILFISNSGLNVNSEESEIIGELSVGAVNSGGSGVYLSLISDARYPRISVGKITSELASSSSRSWLSKKSNWSSDSSSSFSSLL